jgi:hypothetical protein
MSIKVCDSNTLLVLAAAADKYEFNRRVVTEELVKDIDPNGINIVSLVLPYHRASFGPTVEPRWPDHHRCEVYCKVTGKDDPVRFYLDIEAEKFNALADAKELNRRLEEDPFEKGFSAGIAAARREMDMAHHEEMEREIARESE